MRKLIFLVALLLGGLPGPAAPQDAYPSKPLRVMVPSRGETIGVLARTLASAFAQQSGQPLTIYYPGPSGREGIMELARTAPADGYTILISSDNTAALPTGFSPVVLLARSADRSHVFGMYLPVGAPEDVVSRLNAMVNAILRTPDIVQKVAMQGLQVGGGTPADLARVALVEGNEPKKGEIAALPTRGVLTFGGGARYEGDLVHGKPHGKGVITFPSGARYEGEFVGNKYQGKGIYTSPSGQRYEGDHVAGARQGKGVLTWPSGQRYEGDFMNDKYSGYGVMTLSDGTRYAGNWLNGERTGQTQQTSQAVHAESRVVNASVASAAGARRTNSGLQNAAAAVKTAAEIQCEQRREETVRNLKARLASIASACPDGGREVSLGIIVCAPREDMAMDQNEWQRVTQAVFEAQEDVTKAELDSSCSLLAPGLEAFRERHKAEQAIAAAELDTERAGRTQRRQERERDWVADSSTSNGQDTSVGAYILQKGEEMERMLNRVDRQTIAALGQAQREREKTAARERAERAEREEREAERRRDAARERASHADAERTARARAAQPAPEPPKYQPRAATLPKADLQINPQSRSTATLAANTGREQPSGAATQARAENVRSNPTPGSGRAVHEVEEDLSAYKGWAVIARGDHMASREASCNDNKAKVARKLSRDKTAAQGLVNQSPCVCTKWWNDDRAVPGMWQCAILGQYTGKGDGGSVEK